MTVLTGKLAVLDAAHIPHRSHPLARALRRWIGERPRHVAKPEWANVSVRSWRRQSALLSVIRETSGGHTR